MTKHKRNVKRTQPGGRPDSTDLVGIVAGNVRALAARQALSQTELARRLGVSHTWVNVRWNGGRPWSLADLEAVSVVLGTTPDDLLRPVVFGAGRGQQQLHPLLQHLDGRPLMHHQAGA